MLREVTDGLAESDLCVAWKIRLVAYVYLLDASVVPCNNVLYAL